MEATTDEAMACFDPGHGARFRGQEGGWDVLVCFSCSSYRVYGQSREDVVGDSFEGAAVAPWSQAFSAAGLGKNAGSAAP